MHPVQRCECGHGVETVGPAAMDKSVVSAAESLSQPRRSINSHRPGLEGGSEGYRCRSTQLMKRTNTIACAAVRGRMVR